MNVQYPRYPFITNPANIHLISDIPDPAAYFAKDRTRCAAVNDSVPYRFWNPSLTWAGFLLRKRNVTYSNDDVDHPSRGSIVTPIMP